MNDISIDRTVWAGFRLVGRNPGAFALWALVYLILGLGPSALLIGLAGPEFLDAVRAGVASGGHADPATVIAASTRAQAANSVSLLANLVLFSVVYAAIFRAVLQPERRRFGYLRLSMDEVRVGLVLVGFYIVLVVAMVVAILISAIAVGVAVLAHSVAATIVLGTLFGIGTIVGLAWMAVRLSMVLPMTFAEHRIEIGHAWAMTRGRTGKLFVVALVLVLISLGLGIAVLALFGVTAATLMASLGDAASIKSYFSQPAAALIRNLTPWGVIIAMLSALFGSLQITVLAAPWAVAYRQIAVDRDEIEVFA